MPSEGRITRQLALLGSLGVSFAVASAGGFVLGSWLDGRLGTKPVLTIACGLLGVAAAFFHLVRTLGEAERLERDEPPVDHDGRP